MVRKGLRNDKNANLSDNLKDVSIINSHLLAINYVTKTPEHLSLMYKYSTEKKQLSNFRRNLNLITRRGKHRGSRRKLINNQHVQKCYYDKKGVKNLPKVKGDKIVIRKDGIWEPGTVIGEHQSPRSYMVEDDSGKILRRNRKLLKTSSSDFSKPSDESSEGSGRSEGRVSRTIRKPVRFDDYILS
ncbi:hypothetical protein JTB14_016699 [Gonioctena quinquepunctata]|nr:hypothetical protein JTB14_016699 [Gonioctena quinquepunctata]